MYRDDLDLLKGLAILGVIFYHMGFCPSGYLGVDLFFVINGFLIVPKVLEDITNERFHYFLFLEKRILRLLPLVLLVSVFVLLSGYYGMLPDDYENLSESVVATGLFSNNILAALTTRDYWAASNEYKPLMHMWYVGILFEFYVVTPLFLLAVKKLSNWRRFAFKKNAVLILSVLSVISFLLYMSPNINAGDKFYLLPFRFYELCAGGIAGIWVVSYRQKRLLTNPFLSGTALAVVAVIIFAGVHYAYSATTEYDLVSATVKNGDYIIHPSVLLFSTVLLATFLCLSDNRRNRLFSILSKGRVLPLLGMMSYSLFIWHQPFLAFYRYYVGATTGITFFALFLFGVMVISYASYQIVEKRNLLSTGYAKLIGGGYFVDSHFSISKVVYAGRCSA